MKPLANLLYQLHAGLMGVMGLMGLFSATDSSAVTYPLRWRWSNPSPHGGNVWDMAYHPGLYLAVQVAERGQIYTSDNLDLWLPRDSQTTNALRGVAFFGPRIILTGENGCVLYADEVNDFRSGTLIDGSTTNWLEAVTVAPSYAAPVLLVAVGDNGAIYTSNNGVTWKKQNSGLTDWLRGVAFANGTFVAVGEQGTVATSPNGTNWARRTSGTSKDLNRVTFASGRFTAVGDDGVTVCSTNGGVNWFSDYSGATNFLQHAAAGMGDRLVTGDHEVRLNEGAGWSNELAKTNGPPDWSYYSGLGLPGFFLIAGQTGMQSEGYQTNGAPYFWLTPYDSVRNWLWDVVWAGSLYVTVGDFGTVMTSGGGVNWTLELVPSSVTNTTFLGIGGTTNLLIAVGDNGSVIVSPNNLTNVITTDLTGTVSTQTMSSLGVVWYPVLPRPSTNDLQGVGVLSNSLYIITGDYGTVLTSPDGTNWTSRATPATNLLTSVADWPGGLVATGDDGAVITSPDGITWTVRTPGTTNWLYRVRYLNGTLIAVGQHGTLLTSTNGTNWTPRSSGTTQWLNDVTFIGDTYFIVGNKGTVLTSTNLVHWTHQGTISKKSLYGVATDSRQLITVGVEGCILRSQVLPDLTPISVLAYSHFASTNNPSLTHNLFLFGGHTDQRFTLDRTPSVTATNWTVGSPLEIFDSSGTLYYLETFASTNQPPLEFYRAPLIP